MVNISSNFSTTIDYYEILIFYSLLMNTNLGESSKFSMSSVSVPSSSSSTINWRVAFLNKTVIFFENKTRKIKQFQWTKPPLFYFIYICFINTVEKIVTKENQLRWMVNIKRKQFRRISSCQNQNMTWKQNIKVKLAIFWRNIYDWLWILWLVNWN